MFSRLQIEIKDSKYLHLTVLHVFYKHIKIRGLGLDMLKATQNIDWILFFKDVAKVFS